MKKRTECLVTDGQKQNTLLTKLPDVKKGLSGQRELISQTGIYEEYYDLYVKDDFAHELWDRDAGIAMLTSYNMIKLGDMKKPRDSFSEDSRMSRRLSIYFNHSEQIIMINEIETHISWISVNLMSQYDVNKFILKHLINQTDEFMFYHSIPDYDTNILSRIGIDVDVSKVHLVSYALSHTYCRLAYTWKKTGEIEGLKSNMGNYFYESMGDFYSGSLDEKAGAIARDMIEIPKRFKEKCAKTENDEFLKWLNHYCELLSKCKEWEIDLDYCEKINICGMYTKLRENQFHLLSEDESIRQLYSRVLKKCDDIYTSYCNIFR